MSSWPGKSVVSMSTRPYGRPSRWASRSAIAPELAAILEARSPSGEVVTSSSSPRLVGVASCRWNRPRPIRCATECHHAFFARQAAASAAAWSRRARAARTARWVRSHAVPAGGPGEVGEGQPRRVPGERAEDVRGGHPPAGRRGGSGDLGGGHRWVLGGGGAPFGGPPGQRRGEHRPAARVQAGQPGGVHDLGCGPHERDGDRGGPLGGRVPHPPGEAGPRPHRHPGRPARVLLAGVRRERTRRLPAGQCHRRIPASRRSGPAPGAIRGRAHRIGVRRRPRR